MIVSFRNVMSVFFGTVVLFGCGTIPETTIKTSMTARPVAPVISTASNGAIFQASSYRPLFEDRRPRMVGDIVTIAINEKTSASKSGGSSASKTGSVTSSVPKLFGIPAATTAQLGVSASSSSKYETKAAETAGNNFTGTIGATVIEVLPNGNLVVAGEKQISFDEGSEFVRFYGVVNPDSIVAGNMVSSNQVADAKFEYRTNTRLDSAAVLGMLSRFFLSVLPL
jgi:flagellar L-ring protein precursor FlgH